MKPLGFMKRNSSMAVLLNQIIHFRTMAAWRFQVAPNAVEMFLVGARCLQFHCHLGEILRGLTKQKSHVEKETL